MASLDDDAGKTGQKITKKRVASALIKAGNIQTMNDPVRGQRQPPVLTYADRDRMAATVIGGGRPESDDSDSVSGQGPKRAQGKLTGSAVASVSGSSSSHSSRSSSQGKSSSSDRPSSNGKSKSPYSSHGRSSSGDKPPPSDGQSRPSPRQPSGPSPGRAHTETGKRRRTEDAASNDSASRRRPPPPPPRTPHSGSSKPRPPSTPKPRPPSTPKRLREGGSTPGELRD